MSDQEDQESKTEDATEKKLRDAVERGNTPSSREAPIFASISAALLASIFLLRSGAAETTAALAELLADPAGFDLSSGGNVTALLFHVLARACLFLAPVLLLFVVLGLGAGFLLHPPQLALERITPQWSRLSPAKGLS
ncbi:MAG: EscU/YscU/HrcU family type III secretion system export apparatus switch protein, partial [Bosea sp. (in: a-proteobacteria)]